MRSIDCFTNHCARSSSLPVIELIIFLKIREDDDEGDVPPDCEVTYKLELLSIMPGPDIANLTDEQRITLGYVCHSFHCTFQWYFAQVKFL